MSKMTSSFMLSFRVAFTFECRFVNLKRLSEYFNVEIDYFTRPLDDANCKFLTKKESNGYVKYNEQIR